MFIFLHEYYVESLKDIIDLMKDKKYFSFHVYNAYEYLT